jgi:hypothetical protein
MSITGPEMKAGFISVIREKSFRRPNSVFNIHLLILILMALRRRRKLFRGGVPVKRRVLSEIEKSTMLKNYMSSFLNSDKYASLGVLGFRAREAGNRQIKR